MHGLPSEPARFPDLFRSVAIPSRMLRLSYRTMPASFASCARCRKIVGNILTVRAVQEDTTFWLDGQIRVRHTLKPGRPHDPCHRQITDQRHEIGRASCRERVTE